MLLHGCIVVEEQFLPVGTKALDSIAIGIDQVIGIGIERCLTTVDVLLVLQDGIVGGTGHIALLPGTLPAVTEVVVDLCLTHLTFLGGHENHTVGSTGTVNGTRGSILQHLDTLDIIRVH